jgi:hypothetical protein
MDTRVIYISKDTNIAKHLFYIHGKNVVVIAEKVSNNIAFGCNSHDIDRLRIFERYNHVHIIFTFHPILVCFC